VTSAVIITARKRPQGGGGAVTEVTCRCTKSEPNMPDCKPVTTQDPGGHTVRVKCTMSGGCEKCKETTKTTSGVIMF
jgi:hypothetical protein